ncbi:polymer-forming cytoskeletal protein [Thiomicrospira sp. ALE5]|uniref:bactofilin family protein n=1 Tax=Thiomicrospira sp. ALE5 TaxID=748650 RepID=UPI0008E1380D|nr:polymer-forming cytoskeletal protein [Thiomicrospira sp. ALE5]SFR48768.1 Polymer-forming protein [Thiomicrospira sp. ALE5]
MLIDGVVEGQVYSQHEVIIGLSGSVIGQINAQKVYINGILKGSVSAQEVEVLCQGQLYGDLLSGDLIIEKGGRFLGNSHGLEAEATEDLAKLLPHVNQDTEVQDEKDSK